MIGDDVTLQGRLVSSDVEDGFLLQGGESVRGDWPGHGVIEDLSDVLEPKHKNNIKLGKTQFKSKAFRTKKNLKTTFKICVKQLKVLRKAKFKLS